MQTIGWRLSQVIRLWRICICNSSGWKADTWRIKKQA